MLYLSQVLDSRVEDSADRFVGKITDVLVKPGAGVYAPLAYLLVKKNKEEIFIPYEFVENLSRSVVDLKTAYNKYKPQKPEAGLIYLSREILDQQIVDLDGARVVRVNDLSLGAFDGMMCVLGIDISFKGILRRLGIDFLDFKGFFKANLIDWKKTQRVKGALQLDTISRDLTRLHAADLANIVEDLNLHYGTNLVNSLEVRDAAKVMEELNPHLQKILVTHLGPERAARIIEKMSSDEIVDLMQLFTEREAKPILSLIQTGKLKKVEKLIKYEDDTAGGLMTADFISVLPDWTAEQTIEEIRRHSPNMRSILFVYAVDELGKFLGPTSLRKLILARKEQKISELYKPADNLTVLHPDNTVEEIVTIMTKYDLYSAVVLSEDKKILGVVAIDDVMRCLAPKA